jgi:hypothetical protein
MIKQILVLSTKRIGPNQVLKDSLTPTEKKIIIQMINTGISEGKVKNKTFVLFNKTSKESDLKIYTLEKSEILKRYETTTRNLKIGFK